MIGDVYINDANINHVDICFYEFKDGKVRIWTIGEYLTKVEKNSPLILIEKHNLDLYQYDLRVDMFMQAACRISCLMPSENIYIVMDVFKKSSDRKALKKIQETLPDVKNDKNDFWEMWKANKEIPGYVCLSGESNLVWVSEIDLKHMTKVKKNV